MVPEAITTQVKAKDDLMGREADWNQMLKTQTEESLKSLRNNRYLNFWSRVIFLVAAGVLLAILITYINRRFDSMVGVLLDTDLNDYWFKALAVSWPVVVELILAVACVAAAFAIQTRSREEFASGLEGISRFRREAAVGVPRSRAVVEVFEENIANARRAFSLQLWTARVLFIVALALFAFAVVHGVIVGKVTLLSAVSVAGGLGTLLTSFILGRNADVTKSLSDVTQLQAVLAAFMREVSFVDEQVFQVLEHARATADPQGSAEVVDWALNHMESITDRALRSIEERVQGTPSVPVGPDARNTEPSKSDTTAAVLEVDPQAVPPA
jgi:hypothetical protein